MSINSASYIAYAALMAIEVRTTVASANISNADTVGYTRKVANQTSMVNGSQGAGVAITGITSTVDKLLTRSLIGSNSTLGYSSSVNSYLNQLQQLFGTTTTGNNGPGTSLGNTLAALETAVQGLANAPSDASQQANVVQALNTVAAQLRQTSSGIQNLRGNVDQNIASSVDDVNQQLQQIASLNKQIMLATAAGQPTGDLEDQRNTALQDVSSNMDVSYFTGSNGSLQVYTASGQALVTDSIAHTLSYQPAASVNEGTTYSATPPSGFNGIMLNGQDITSQIHSGSIGGLIDLRDNELPAAQSELDELANQLASSLNAVHNAGTAIPAPATLTGNTAVTASTPISATGTVRLAVTDSQGNLVSYQDLNLSGITTVGGLVSAINGGSSGLTASIDSNGHLVITAPSGDGVAINEMSSAVGSSNQGFSDYFGLNDLVTETGAADFSVRSDILSNPALFASGTLNSSATLTTGKNVLPPGSGTMPTALQNALSGQTSFSAAGGLGATSTSFASYGADIVSFVATKASNANSDFKNKQAAQQTFSSALTSQSGVNVDQETANLSSLQNQYNATAELISVINQMFSSLITALQSA